VRFIVLAFVFIAGAITLAGPQLGIGKHISAAQKTVPAEKIKTNLTTSAEKPANRESDTTG
jgi:hypothetical protein